MTNQRRQFAVMAGFAAMFLSGCAQPKMTLDDLKKMPAPEKPKELALLEPLVGNWTSAGEMRLTGLDKPISGTGASTIAWDCDGRVLVEHWEWQMPDMGAMGTMRGISLYFYDPQEKEFHTFWTASNGETSHGEMKYDEKTKTWSIEEKGRDPMTGEKVKSKGTMKVSDNNTIEWQMVQTDAMGLTKKMEMKGTSKRK